MVDPPLDIREASLDRGPFKCFLPAAQKTVVADLLGRNGIFNEEESELKERGVTHLNLRSLGEAQQRKMLPHSVLFKKVVSHRPTNFYIADK
ncbi:hypothetical protein EVAR_92095_1 [Eumeta japonica]|uniref:Uncharacterized protein n=1 Tax=Eumeta variegata TaxID=151549 RepID=A0A4C1T0Y8_EUMVA|nr:hypothetical protein EVAR_92095_1 [Eumeta japonica]